MRLRVPLKALLVPVLIAAGCSHAPAGRPSDRPSRDGYVRQKAVKAMDSTFRVRLWPSGKEREHVDGLLKKAVEEVLRVGNMVHPSYHGSELRRVNEGAPRMPFGIAPEFFGLLEKARAMWERSGGAFDVTYQLEGQNEKKEGVLDLKLDKRMFTVRFENLYTRINLNGLARGYAAQRVMEVLQGKGLAGYAVTASGLVAAAGVALKDPDLMCIENPQDLGSCRARIEALNPSKPLYVATSGSQGRRGKLYNATDDWTYRTAGVTVAGDDGAWVQFAATVSAVLSDEKLEELFGTTKPPRLAGVYFRESGGGMKLRMQGDLEPFAKTVSLSRD